MDSVSPPGFESPSSAAAQGAGGNNGGSTEDSLSPGELDGVRRALGPTASMLACAVAKLYVCARGDKEYRFSGVWGALVLVVDRTPPTSKALQIYALHPAPAPSPTSLLSPTPASPVVMGGGGVTLGPCVFSCQVYESLVYLALNPQFHTFEASCGMIGLSFARRDEAHRFLVKVRAHVPQHGSVGGAPTRKTSFLARLFGGSGSGGSGGGGGINNNATLTVSAGNGSLISSPDPASVKKHHLPEEWMPLFKNAAVIAATTKQMAQMQQQQQQQQAATFAAGDQTRNQEQ